MVMVLHSDSINAARDIAVPGRKTTRKKSLVLGTMGYNYSSVTCFGLFTCGHSTGKT